MSEAELNRWLLITALALLIIVPAVLTVWLKDAGLVWPVTLACITAVLLIRLPDVELFKAGPVEARMRAATQKAEATIEQLQQLAGALANPVLGAVMASGRLGGYPRKASLDMRDRVVSELKAIGLNDKQISDATAQYNYYLGTDLLYDLRGVVHSEFEGNVMTGKATLCFNNAGGSFYSDVKVSILRDCLKEAGVLTERVSSALDDLEQFQNDATLRRPEVFINRPH